MVFPFNTMLIKNPMEESFKLKRTIHYLIHYSSKKLHFTYLSVELTSQIKYLYVWWSIFTLQCSCFDVKDLKTSSTSILTDRVWHREATVQQAEVSINCGEVYTLSHLLCVLWNDSNAKTWFCWASPFNTQQSVLEHPRLYFRYSGMHFA